MFTRKRLRRLFADVRDGWRAHWCWFTGGHDWNFIGFCTRCDLTEERVWDLPDWLVI